MSFDAGTAKLVWHGVYPAAVVEQVRTDIADELIDLGCAADLVFHTVFLGDDLKTCPVVMVWGEEGSDALHCEYHAKSEWVSLSEMEDDL